ncbi:MAG: class I SAM-dependent methyltransferase [Armatimonadetes bacterium]|nr:class I SAM-dependent methyltransferase [Armatimonadota bacterium]
MRLPYRHPGSFRDPDSGVLIDGDRVLRYFSPRGAADFAVLAETGLIDSLAGAGKVVPYRVVDASRRPAAVRELAPDASLVVEHPRLPFISYPYEWSFDMLKAAALLHLDILKCALSDGWVLKDASPYNIQFAGSEPVFIDLGSFTRYEPGKPWAAYHQFCQMFLAPLLLQAAKGVPFQPWLRACVDGIPLEHLYRMLALRQKLRGPALLHVVMPVLLNRLFGSTATPSQAAQARRLHKTDILRLVDGLSAAVASLRSAAPPSAWTSYEAEDGYDAQARAQKLAFVEHALGAAKPKMVWDLGCNQGRYSVAASRHAEHVIAMDRDEGVVNALYHRVRDSHRNVLPLVLDVTNPSPDQGWAQCERAGLAARGPADFVLCLALIHHVVVAGNVPLRAFVAWLAEVAREGILEFVPSTDPAAARMLQWRRGVGLHPGYDQSGLEAALREHFTVQETARLQGSERLLYWFRR